ncbi:MAG: LamG domain-containing protein [Catenulispora sp.]
MTSFPPAETGFFPAAGFQAPPEAAPEPRLLLDPPADIGGGGPGKRRRGLLIGASVIAVVGVTAGVIALAGGGDGEKPPVAAASSSPTSAAPVDTSAVGSSAADREGRNMPGGTGSPAASASTVPPSAGSTPGHTTSTPAAPKTTAPAPVVAPPADLLHWRLSEAAGAAAADSSGHGLAGTVSGAAAFAPGQHGGAVFFNGPAGQIKGGEVATKAPAIDATKSFTVSMWIDQTGLTTPTKYAAAFSQDGPQCFAFTFSYSTEAQRWSFVRADEDGATPTSVGVGSKAPTPLNTWLQLTGVYDAPAGTIAFYVNGVPQGTAKTGSAPYAVGGPFAIGRSRYGKYPSNPFNGYISDVRIYSRALSAAEVAAL